MSYRFIAVEGNIGVGKTTLSRMIAQHYNSRLILEEFVDNLQQKDLEKIRLFFETMPEVKKGVHFKCPKCEYEEDITIKGMQSFFV